MFRIGVSGLRILRNWPLLLVFGMVAACQSKPAHVPMPAPPHQSGEEPPSITPRLETETKPERVAAPRAPRNNKETPAEMALRACAHNRTLVQKVERYFTALPTDQQEAFAKRCAGVGESMRCEDRAALIGTLVHLVTSQTATPWDFQFDHVLQWSTQQALSNATTGLSAQLLRGIDAKKAPWLVRISVAQPQFFFDEEVVNAIEQAADADLVRFMQTLDKIRAGAAGKAFRLSGHTILSDVLLAELRGEESLATEAWNVMCESFGRAGSCRRPVECPNYASLEQFVVGMRRYPSTSSRTTVTEEAWHLHPNPLSWRSRLHVVQTFDPRLFRFSQNYNASALARVLLGMPSTRQRPALDVLNSLIPNGQHYHSVKQLLEEMATDAAFTNTWPDLATAMVLRLWPSDACYPERLFHYFKFLHAERDGLHEEMSALVEAVVKYDEKKRAAVLQAVRRLFGEIGRGVDQELATWMVDKAAELPEAQRDGFSVQMHKDAQILKGALPNDVSRWVETMWHLRFYVFR